MKQTNIKYTNYSTDVFEGFYESGLYNSDTLYNISESEGIEWDFVDNGWEQYQIDVAKKCCEILLERLQYDDYKNDLCIESIDFIEMNSPRFYNYGTDTLTLDIKCDFDKIKKYALVENKEKFATYLKENFTTCSGFISFVPNNITDFINFMTEDVARSTDVLMEFYILSRIDIDKYKLACYEAASDILWNYIALVSEQND